MAVSTSTNGTATHKNNNRIVWEIRRGMLHILCSGSPTDLEIMMVILGGLVALTKGSIVTPVIYTIFEETEIARVPCKLP